MAGKEPDIGPTARTVAANVERLRGELNLNYTQLSERLQEVARWSINAVGIRRIESGERRVTPDDLVALARALGVWPITLLMPYTEDAAEEVTATGVPDPVDAATFWGWLTAMNGLYGGTDEWVETMHAGHPGWEVREFYQNAHEQAVQERRREGIDLDEIAARAAHTGERERGDD
jgi:transcriptional regulator with XRE-family HTH domain